MARIDRDNSGNDIINVEGKVGVRCTNAFGDVIVVQAMLGYLQHLPFEWTRSKIPVPNGTFDQITERAILDYQQFVRDRKDQLDFWVAKDGEVAPFLSQTELLHKQQWTIVAMNRDCSKVNFARRDETSYIDTILRQWPAAVFDALEGHRSFNARDRSRFSLPH